jgi:hypothetical protein
MGYEAGRVVREMQSTQLSGTPGAYVHECDVRNATKALLQSDVRIAQAFDCEHFTAVCVSEIRFDTAVGADVHHDSCLVACALQCCFH